MPGFVTYLESRTYGAAGHSHLARFTIGPSHTKLVAHVAPGSHDRRIDAKRGSAWICPASGGADADGASR